MNIHQIQQEIVDEFACLNDDVEQIMDHIVSLGRILPEMPGIYRIDENLIRGCHSKVWLAATVRANRTYFYADSDTLITRGLVSLLLRVFNGQNRDDVLSAELNFIKRSHLERFVGTKRSNGFYAMIDQIKTSIANHP